MRNKLRHKPLFAIFFLGIIYWIFDVCFRHFPVFPMVGPGAADFSYAFTREVHIERTSASDAFLGRIEPKTTVVVPPSVFAIAEFGDRLIVQQHPLKPREPTGTQGLWPDHSQTLLYVVDIPSASAVGPFAANEIVSNYPELGPPNYKPISCWAPYFIRSTFDQCGLRLFLRRFLPGVLL